MKTNVNVYSRMPTKITYKLFQDLMKISSLVAEFKGALTLDRERPSLFSHKSRDIKILWDLHKKDMEECAVKVLSEVH